MKPQGLSEATASARTVLEGAHTRGNSALCWTSLGGTMDAGRKTYVELL
jgi:hypothetical protein